MHPDVVNPAGVWDAAEKTQSDMAALQAQQQTNDLAAQLAPYKVQAAQQQAQTANLSAQEQQQDFNEWQMADAYKGFDPDSPTAAQDWKAINSRLQASGNPLAEQWSNYPGEYGFRHMMGIYGQGGKATPLEGYGAGAVGAQTAPSPDAMFSQDYLTDLGRRDPDKLRQMDQSAQALTGALDAVMRSDNPRATWDAQAIAIGHPEWVGRYPGSLDEVEQMLAQAKGHHAAIQKVTGAMDIGAPLPGQPEDIKEYGGTAYAVARDPATGKVSMRPMTQNLEEIGSLSDGRAVLIDKNTGEYAISPMPVGPKPGTEKGAEPRPMSPQQMMIEANKIVGDNERNNPEGTVSKPGYDHNAEVANMFATIAQAGEAGTTGGAPAAAPTKQQAAAADARDAVDVYRRALSIKDPIQRRQSITRLNAMWAQNWKAKGYQGRMPTLDELAQRGQ